MKPGFTAVARFVGHRGLSGGSPAKSEQPRRSGREPCAIASVARCLSSDSADGSQGNGQRRFCLFEFDLADTEQRGFCSRAGELGADLLGVVERRRIIGGLQDETQPMSAEAYARIIQLLTFNGFVHLVAPSAAVFHDAFCIHQEDEDTAYRFVSVKFV